MFERKAALRGVSTSSSVAERGCRGKLAVEDLQALRAQVRKLSVRSFMVFGCCGCGMFM
jgi:hypothetical protein